MTKWPPVTLNLFCHLFQKLEFIQQCSQVHAKFNPLDLETPNPPGKHMAKNTDFLHVTNVHNATAHHSIQANAM